MACCVFIAALLALLLAIKARVFGAARNTSQRPLEWRLPKREQDE